MRVCRAAGVRVYADAVVNHMTGTSTFHFISSSLNMHVFPPSALPQEMEML